MENFDQDKYRRAKKRVEEIKGFYIHLTVYIVINLFLLINLYFRTLNNSGSFWQIYHFFTPFFWGIGLAFHAANTFNLIPFLGKHWEEKQIQKYLDEDRKKKDKLK